MGNEFLVRYGEQNALKINAAKTKCMFFYRGRPPKDSFTLGTKNLENVNNFTYLGFKFTTQLSFSSHLDAITAKANSRCGTLNARLPIRHLPIDLTLRIYNCYILPLFRYGRMVFLFIFLLVQIHQNIQQTLPSQNS